MRFITIVYLNKNTHRNQLVPGGSSRVWPLTGLVSFGRPFCSNGSFLPRLRVKFRTRQRRCNCHPGTILYNTRHIFGLIFNSIQFDIVRRTCSNCMARASRWTRLRSRSNLHRREGSLRRSRHGRMLQKTMNSAHPMSKSIPFLLDPMAKFTSLKVNNKI